MISLITGLSKEDLLKIWLDEEPTEKSPYNLYGNPPMWETMRLADLVLFTCPGTAQERTPSGFKEVRGVRYQFQRNGKWVGQGVVSSFKTFQSQPLLMVGV